MALKCCLPHLIFCLWFSGIFRKTVVPLASRTRHTFFFPGGFCSNQPTFKKGAIVGKSPGLPDTSRGIVTMRPWKCDGVVTGCDGKGHGLNICKLLRINMCD